MFSSDTCGPSCSKGGKHYPVDNVVCFASTYPLDCFFPLDNQGLVKSIIMKRSEPGHVD